MQQTDSITKTRTTRMIYVEEISDTEVSERRNSTYKSFESEMNVEEVTKSTSSTKVTPRGSPGKKKPSPDNQNGQVSQQISASLKPQGDGSKKLATPIASPAKASGLKSPKKATALTSVQDKIQNELNKSQTVGISRMIKDTESDKDSTGLVNVSAEKDKKEKMQEATIIIDMEEESKEASEATMTLEREKHIKSKPIVVGDINEGSDKIGLKSERDVDTISTISTVPALPSQIIGVEKPVPYQDTTPILPTRKFTKNFSSGSMVSSLSGGGGPQRGWSDDEGNEPPGRKGIRKNVLLSMKSKRAFHVEVEKTIEEALLYETLRPLMICMKISGIFFVRKKGQFGKTFREVLRSCTALQIYCLCMCGLLLLNFLRSMLAFDPNDGFSNAMFLKFLTAIFMYESSSRAGLAYWHALRKTKGLQDFFLSLEKICYSDSIIPYEGLLRGVMKSAIVISILISLANMGCNAYGMFGPASHQFDSYLVPVPPDAPGIEAMKVFILILVLINATVAMLSLSFFTVICYVLYKEFEYLCRTFVMKIRDDGSFTDDLEKFRITHQKRCKLVEDADSMFKYYIANTYMTNVPLLCILLYVIVYAEGSDLSYTVINAFRLFYVLVQMVVVSVAATLINNQAHAPLADIYSIKVHSATTERQLEVNMFLNKLTGTSIGLTAWDMFVINKPTVLTVVGMVLTYFFLLVQFKNPLGEPTKCECMVNVTSTVLRSLVSDVSTTAMTDAVTDAVTEAMTYGTTAN